MCYCWIFDIRRGKKKSENLLLMKDELGAKSLTLVPCG